MTRENHNSAALERRDLAVEALVRQRMNQALQYQKYCNIDPIRTKKELMAIQKALTTQDKLIDALRDQIRVREHVYGVKKSALPKLGSGFNDTERIRLVQALNELITKVLPINRPPCPLPHFLRPQHQAPSKLAIQIDFNHMKSISEALTKVHELTANGIFSFSRTAAQSNEDEHDGDEEVEDGFVAVPAATSKAIKIGARFIEDNISWKVLSMEFSDEYKEFLVWYYDIDMAPEQKISEDQMHSALRDNQSLDCMERSRCSEVRKWIRASNKK